MDEIFVEQIVKRKTGISVVLMRVFSIIVLIMVFLLMIMLNLGILAFTIEILIIYGEYMLWCYTSIEYEYSLVNGEFSVDKIMGQRKRKNIANYEIKDAEVIAPINSEQVIRGSMNAIVKDYSTGRKSEGVYAMIISNNDGKTKVVIEPNEKVIDALYHCRPNIVVKNV